MALKNLLVHACCAPCFIYPGQVLEAEGHRLTGFYFNPNIHAYQEYHRRYETLAGYLDSLDIAVVVGAYDVKDYFREVAFREADRCRFCYKLRLAATAELAQQDGYDAFTTTLLVSPYQDHLLIKELGESIGRQAGVSFLYRDFRDGYRLGAARARELSLYRQSFCGCVFSSQERYEKRKLGFSAASTERRR